LPNEVGGSAIFYLETFSLYFSVRVKRLAFIFSVIQISGKRLAFDSREKLFALIVIQYHCSPSTFKKVLMYYEAQSALMYAHKSRGAAKNVPIEPKVRPKRQNSENPQNVAQSTKKSKLNDRQNLSDEKYFNAVCDKITQIDREVPALVGMLLMKHKESCDKRSESEVLNLRKELETANKQRIDEVSSNKDIILNLELQLETANKQRIDEVSSNKDIILNLEQQLETTNKQRIAEVSSNKDIILNLELQLRRVNKDFANFKEVGKNELTKFESAIARRLTALRNSIV